MVARETGRTDLAIRSLQRALNQYEPHPVNHAHLAAALADVGRVAEALAHVGRPGARCKVRESVRTGRLSGRRRIPLQSKLVRSLQLTPHDAVATAALSRSLVATGRLDGALDVLRKAIVETPDQPHLHLGWAKHCWKTNVLTRPSCLSA